MSDLTVLVSPTPLYPRPQSPLTFNFARRSENDLTRPVMVTLENVDPDGGPHSPVEVRNFNEALLSPPKKSFRRPSPPERPASAPPTLNPSPKGSVSVTPPRISVPRKAFSSSTPTDRSELSRPPPPLFRPTTFWRKTKRSGVTGASYSPSSHLIRRSTFIAAGLSFDRPAADLSAFESLPSRRTMVYINALVTSTTPLSTVPTTTHPGSVNHHQLNRAMSTTSSDSLLGYLTSGDTTTSLTDTSDLDVGVATGVPDVAVSSDTSTGSLIQITALPPATTPPQTVTPKLAYDRQFNVLYLTPLFAALGIVLGVIVVVLGFKWRARRRRWRRTSTLQPGPPYAPPENDVEDRLLVHGSQSMEQVSLFAAGTPSKFTVHGSRYTPQRSLAWPRFDKDRPSSYSQRSYTETIIPSIDGERFTVLVQDDPFLVTPTGATEQSPKNLSLPRIRVSPSMPEPMEDRNHIQEPDPGSPKPFRRSMFDILKLRGPYRPVPNVYSDSKTVRIVTLSGNTGVTGTRRHSLERNLGADDTPDSMVDMTEGKGSVSGLGILPGQEIHSTEASLTSSKRVENARKPRIVTPYPSETQVTPKQRETVNEQAENRIRGERIDEEQAQDIYTKAPERRRSRSRPHSQKSLTNASRRFSASDAHASILPLSPPSLMSPPLEKSLFFTSLPSSSASLSRANTVPISSSQTQRIVQCSPETSLFPLPSKKARYTKKLRTRRAAPPLPYPSYPDVVDAQSTSRDRTTSFELTRFSLSPGSPKPKGRSTSATNLETMNGMWSYVSLSPTALALTLGASPSDEVLSKVNDIVAQGYTMKRTAEG